MNKIISNLFINVQSHTPHLTFLITLTGGGALDGDTWKFDIRIEGIWAGIIHSLCILFLSGMSGALCSSSDYRTSSNHTYRFKADALGHIEVQFRLKHSWQYSQNFFLFSSTLNFGEFRVRVTWAVGACNVLLDHLLCSNNPLLAVFRPISVHGITWMSKILMSRAGPAMAAAYLLRPISGPGYYPVPYSARVSFVATSRILPWLCINLSTKAANIGIKNAQNANRRVSAPLPRFRCIITYSISILHFHICWNIVT